MNHIRNFCKIVLGQTTIGSLVSSLTLGINISNIFGIIALIVGFECLEVFVGLALMKLYHKIKG
jgi:hypothetical protein